MGSPLVTQESVQVETWGERPDPILSDWGSTIPGKGDGTRSPIDFDALLDESHHRQYLRPWAIGRGYFDYLIEAGLKPSHTVLDFGYGAGRLGIWLIGYLNRDRYIGIDSHMLSLQAFAEYEIPLHGLASKRPRLVHNGSFDLARCGVAFD